MTGGERPAPRFSICVATYRRPAALGRLLDHLAALEAPDGGFEVVVVDDGSPAADGVADVLAGREASFPVPLRWSTLPANRGRGGARNAAWRTAGGEWVAFTDDDCRPDPKWLLRLLEAAEPGDATGGRRPAVVQGRVIPDPERAVLLADPLARSLRVEKLSGYYETANIAYRREVLEEVGGFDETFAGAGEDTDLGWRLLERGHHAAFAPDAVVVHDVVVRSFRDDLRDRRRWADVVRVARLHPAARRLAWRPLVFRRGHAEPLASIAALPLVLAGRPGRRLYGAAVMVLVARRVAGVRSPRELLRRLQILAGDCYEVGILARASVEQRTVLL